MGVLQERDAKHARDMQEQSVKAVQDLESRTQQLQGLLEQAQLALHAEKAQYGHQETLLQCRNLMDALQTDLTAERHKVKQLAAKSQEAVNAKQEVLEAATAVQVLQLLCMRSPCAECTLLFKVEVSKVCNAYA